VALEARHVQADGPLPGAPVTVVVNVAGLRVEQQGTAVGCPGRACARLHNGRRVEGTFRDGVLEVTP